MANFVETKVLVVGVIEEDRSFNGYGKDMRTALQAAKKQARAFVRRKGLSVRQPNCTQGEGEDGLFTYEFVDYAVPNP